VHVGSYPQALVVDPVRNKIYVANNFGHSVTMIDGATNATSTIQVGQGPGHCSERCNQQDLYGQFGSESVTVIDGATGATASVPAGKHAWAIAVEPGTDKIYAVNEDSASVTIIQGGYQCRDHGGCAVQFHLLSR